MLESTLNCYSSYGTGVTIHGVQAGANGRVEFTTWLSLLWVPLVPLASWSAIYAGERPAFGPGESQLFCDVRRIPPKWARIAKTSLSGLSAATLAVAPTIAMIVITNGRAATNAEMVFVFAAIIWAVGLIIWCERLRRHRLRGASLKEVELLRNWASRYARKADRTRLATDAEVSGEPGGPTGFEDAPGTALIELCDRYWNTLSGPRTISTEEMAARYAEYANAVNELARRGPEVLPWASSRLSHPEYEAREQAAYLIGELARRRLLGDQVGTIIRQLSGLALQPFHHDGKELQGNTAAVAALEKTRDQRAIPALRQLIVLKEWEGDELCWEAACALGTLVNEPFRDTDDPVQAARTWLESHPP